MTDVRLTALNPEDSKVYPVACNASGELLTTKSDDINLDVPGDLTVSGSATFTGDTIIGGDTFQANNAITLREAGQVFINRGTGSALIIQNNGGGNTNENKITLSSEGSASFASNVTTRGLGAYFRVDREVAASGSSVLLLLETQGVEKAKVNTDGSAEFAGDVVIGSRGAKWLIRESNGVAMLIEQTSRGAKEPRIEEVRDLPRELDLVEAALSEIMGKLKMTPPAGWPVWDGETETE